MAPGGRDTERRAARGVPASRPGVGPRRSTAGPGGLTVPSAGLASASRGIPDGMGPLLAPASAVCCPVARTSPPSPSSAGSAASSPPRPRFSCPPTPYGPSTSCGARCGWSAAAAWTTAGGVPDGLPASAGVALQYIALAQAGASSGLWPVAAGRMAAVLVLLPVAARHPGRLRLPPLRALQALLVGAGAALGLIPYLLAAQRQLPAVAVVLASLYPALPVILGPALLHERLSRMQLAGLVGAALATVLLSLGVRAGGGLFGPGLLSPKSPSSTADRPCGPVPSGCTAWPPARSGFRPRPAARARCSGCP